MALSLEACKREQLVVIRFLCSDDEKPADIRRRMMRQFGDPCVSLHMNGTWSFKMGCKI